MQRLLITGVSGMLGAALARAARGRYEVVGTAWHGLPEPTAEVCRLDLTDAEGRDRLLQGVDADVIIHAAAAADTTACELDPAATEAINVVVPAALARWCAEHQRPLIFVSTDLVFDGRSAPYHEDHPPRPLMAYARQKVRAESAVLAAWPKALVCRLPLMFGSDPEGRGAWPRLLAALDAGQRPRLFVDEFRTPLWSQVAAGLLLNALGQAPGILHLGGPERVSRWELGARACRLRGLDPALAIQSAHQAEATGPPRPPDVSLDSGRARALGLIPPPLDDQLAGAL